jgi:sn-glycerol 3-phosphate transport system substrate-binding protein
MRRSLIIGVVALVALAGCGGDDNEPSTGGGGGGGGAGSLPECPLDALAAAPKPVNITYWHAMTRVPAEELQRLTTRFNRQQNDVHVTLSGAASYADNTTRFKAGLGTGKLPDLFQGEDTALQTMIDSRAVVPMQSCLAAESAATDDFVPRVLAYYTVQDVLWPMPFNNSNPILYYNKAAFRRAGLDPEKPPTTLDELRTVSQRIVDKKASPFGIAIKTDSWVMEHWLAKSGHTIVDNDNGRRARATKVTFDDETGTQLFAWIDQMVDDKLALSTSTADIDHYLAVANDRAAMTIDSSAALGTIEQILGAGEFGRVEFGAGPMPGPESPDGGVLVGGAANYIVNKSAPAKQAAAYRFAQYLADAKVQAEWAAATGYTPVRISAATMSPLAERYREAPEYRIPFDQLQAGADNAATAGPVLGPYGARGQGMRGAIIDGLTAMLTGNVTPADAVKQAVDKSNAAIEEYNARVG